MTAIVTRPCVRIVVCGNADRGDDGAALAAVATLLPTLPREILSKLEVRRCQELRVEDLLDLPKGSACLILDAVAGAEAGSVVRMPLSELTEAAGFTPRSSHQLPLMLVIGLAGVMRQRPIEGLFLGIGGRAFGYGTPLSRAVRAGMPAFRAAVSAALSEMTSEPTGRPARPRRGAAAAAADTAVAAKPRGLRP